MAMVFMAISAIGLTGQCIIEGDTSVCPGSVEGYEIQTPIVGEIYIWSVTGGTIQGQNAGDSIGIAWGPGLISGTVSVSIQTPGPTNPGLLFNNTHCLDLETGNSAPGPCAQPSDFSFQSTGGVLPNAVIALVPGSEYAYSSSVSYEDMTRCHADTMNFSAAAPTEVLGAGGVALIKTLGGNIYKIGNVQDLAIISTFSYAQLSATCNNAVDCQLSVLGEETSLLSLGCNDLVHISLDGNCRTVLTADMLLEGETYPNSSYTVVAYDENNIEIPDAILTGAYVGQRCSFVVTHTCSGISCWGEMTVEDKLIGDLMCRDTVIEALCGESLDPEDVGLPVTGPYTYTRVDANTFIVDGFDPCGEAVFRYHDVVEKNDCFARYFMEVWRTWEVEDENGNRTSCVEHLAVLPGTLGNVTFPANHDGFEEFMLECDNRDRVVKSQPIGGYNIGWHSLDNGLPSPHDKVLSASDTLIGTGYPEGVSCDHFAVSYKDRVIETCGENTYKLFRTWRVYDWCSGEILEHIQTIKVIDSQAPVVICPTARPLEVPTDPWTCEGSFIVPDPIFDPYYKGNASVPVILRECNNWTYEILHKVASVGTSSPDECALVDENATFFTTNVRQLPDGRWEVYDMPQGCNWIKYVIRDECGNETICGMEVFVADKENPVAICDEHTVISLNEHGFAELCASSVDNGSLDNCTAYEDLVFEIKRMGDPDSLFSDCMELTCLDVAISPLMLVFRVYDEAGLYNECMVEATVQDKIAPRITCPPTITLMCDEDYHNDSLTGYPVTEDQCGFAQLSSEIIADHLNDCGIGYVIKRWRVEDNGGRFDLCDQRINLIDNDLFDEDDIIWPLDYTLSGCDELDAHPNNLPGPYGWPDYRNRDCAKPASGYEDELLYNQAGYCLQIKRTWEVIDWCQYDVQRGTGPKWIHVQTININNRVRPTITSSCEDETICADANCRGAVSFEHAATDDCTPEEDLIWSYEITEIGSGRVVESGLGNSYSGELDRGQYRVSFRVKDGCGNEDVCNTIVSIRDCKEPTPYCKPGIVTTIMPSSGYVDIWASDFNDASFDNCTASDDLVYSFSEDLRDIVRRVECGDLDNGIVDTFSYEMWVTDEDGNQDYCEVTIIVQDNQDVCPNTGNLTASVGGLITNVNDEEISSVEVGLYQLNIQTGQTMTAGGGGYAFHDLKMHESYSVAPEKNDDHLNGVSTADLVMIQRHLLGKAELSTPYQLIAADANNSESVSASDIAELRKLILGVYSELPRNRSWRFVDKTYQFSDPTDPWLDPLREVVTYGSIDKDEMGTDFIGVKVGDVSGDAEVSGIGGQVVRNNVVLGLEMTEAALEAGEEVSLNIRSEASVSVYGMQMTIELGEQLHFTALKSGSLELTEGNYHYDERRGVLTMSWHQESLKDVEAGEVLFSVDAEVLEGAKVSEVIRVSSMVTRAEAYLEDMEVAVLNVRIGEKDGAAQQGITLYQNIPNPFDHQTVIPFELTTPASATLTVFDVNGKVLLEVYLEGRAGYNEFILNVDRIDNAGVLYYQLESNKEIATRRMLMIN